MLRVQVAVVALALAFIAGNSYASLRPVGDAVTLSEVQGVFDGIGSTIDAVLDQTTEDAFLPTGAGNSVASYVATVSFGWPNMEFGIYNLLDPSQKVKVFDSSAVAAGDSVVIAFDEGLNLVASVNFANPLAPVTIDSTSYFLDFGFYAITTDGEFSPDGYLYSQDFLNVGNYARMLTYQGKGDLVSIGDAGTYPDDHHWYVAVEGGAYYGSDPTGGDFSDMIVQLESITPSDVIPEPGSALLLASAAVGMAAVRRRLLIG